ncbi:MAG TPA: hypothetical protein PK876_06020 [Elusimicrobiota bacterium]|nr:hypothetical protein [Elusimicrobiota bacterium]
MKIVLLVCLCVVLTACAGSRSSVSLGLGLDRDLIESEGDCPLIDDEMSARQCAILEAQKDAVDKAVEMFIPARVREDKKDSIGMIVLAKTSDYVKKYEVLREKKKNGSFHVDLRVAVSMKDVQNDLNAIFEPVGNRKQRVLVLIGEAMDGNPTDRLKATEVFQEAFSGKGFELVERAEVDLAQAMTSLQSIELGDLQSVPGMAQSMRADLLVAGSARSEFRTDQGLGGLVAYDSTVTLQAIHVRTAEVIKTIRKTARGIDVDAEKASAKARENAAKQISNEWIDDLAGTYTKTAGFNLTVTGLQTLRQLDGIRKTAQSVAGVEAVYIRSYEGVTAVLTVETKSVGVNDMALALEKTPSLNAKVREMTRDDILVEIVSK